MDRPRSEVESPEARWWRQVDQLQFFLEKIFKIPKDHALSDVELSHREVRVLFGLGPGQERTMTELAEEMGAPLSTATRMVDRLEAKGLIERLRSKEDRRIVLVRASERGSQMYVAFQEHRAKIAKRMLEPLSVGEREIMLELMEKLSRGLGEAEI